MSELEDRLQSLDARFSALAADLDQRVAARMAALDARIASRPHAAANPGAESVSRGRASGGNARYGLFFGIGTFDPAVWAMKPSAHFAENVENLCNVCVARGGWRAENIQLVLDRDATVQGIRKHMRTLAARLRSGDVALVCFSTHGGHRKGASADDTELCAFDGSYTEKQLREDLLAFPSGCSVVVILQACHSAGMFERGGGVALEPLPRGFLERMQAALSRESRSAQGRIDADHIGWIASAGSDQTSLSGAGGSLVLTHTLVNEGWIGGGADGFVRAVVSENGESAVQSPDALLSVKAIGPSIKTGEVTFLDLAAYATWKWKDVVYGSSGDATDLHIPRYANAPLLRSLVAGTTGVVSRPSPAPDTRASSGTRHALIVGIDTYAIPANPLHGCVVDATNMAAACRELGSWRADHITLLTNEAATLSGIRSALHALADRARPGDVVLYYHAGHGGPSDFTQTSNDTLLFAHDGSYQEAEFREDLCRFRKGVNLIVVVDACFSGGLIRSASGGSLPPSLDAMTGRIDAMVQRIFSSLQAGAPGSFDRLTADDIGWITAVDNGQSAVDCGPDGGLFTSRLFIKQGWRGGGADRIGRGFVTFFDLAEYTRSESMALDHNLCPQYHNPNLLRAVVAGRTGI